MSEIKENLKRVEERIQKACARSGRLRESVELIAVSKTKPASMVLEMYDLGQRAFGENRPQEIRDKSAICPEDIRWHMIGHLQKNKLRYVVGKTALIHSVDTWELAEAIQAEAEKRETEVPVLLEVNVAEEDTKFGLRAEDTPDLAVKIAGLPRVHIQGLMTVAPFVEDPEEIIHALKLLTERYGYFNYPLDRCRGLEHLYAGKIVLDEITGKRNLPESEQAGFVPCEA